MKNMLSALILLIITLSTMVVCAGSATGPYYNHGAYRGMPYRMTQLTASADSLSAKEVLAPRKTWAWFNVGQIKR